MCLFLPDHKPVNDIASGEITDTRNKPEYNALQCWTGFQAFGED